MAINTNGDRDVKKIAIAALMLISGGAWSADNLVCDYARADISKSVNSPMFPLGIGKVEFNGASFKAFRSDGSYVITAPLTTKKDGMIILDDKTKVFAASIDKTNFAVSDRIAKVTDSWYNCKEERKSEGIKPIANPKWRGLTNVEKKSVEDAIKNRLRDPYSAKFTHSKYISNGNGEYCGMVNSKNSYGGYVGKTPFLVMLVGKGNNIHAGIIAFGGNENEHLATIQVCNQIGYFN